jgi:purine-nucleoside phosphorylase
MINLNEKFRSITDALIKEAPFTPDVAIILGSGLGDLADKLVKIKSIATTSLPGYPESTIQGHKGYIHFAEYNGKNVLLFQGRIHFYEGYPLSNCILPVHIAYKLGCRNLLLTNAAGGVNPEFTAGELMLLTSANAMSLKKELTELFGIASFEQKINFYDFPSESLNKKVRMAANDEKISLKEGVYWLSKGPMYETKAEVKMAALYGADAVGMSTVHEAVYGAALGMNVSAISCITNLAAGISPNKLSHSEVMETANHVKADFERLIKRFIELT